MSHACDHAIGVGYDGDGILRYSKANAWEVRDFHGEFKYCPFCGDTLDWSAMLVVANAEIAEYERLVAERVAARMREREASVKRLSALLDSTNADMSPEIRMGLTLFVANDGREQSSQ